MLAVALALHLTFPQPRRSVAFSPERWATGFFNSDAEATNFSAHVGWSLAFPLAGAALAGRDGALYAGSGWVAYSLVNELALHGPEDARERRQNLVSRLIPCAVVLLVEVLRH